jgi:hypothetical protein
MDKMRKVFEEKFTSLDPARNPFTICKVAKYIMFP